MSTTTTNYGLIKPGTDDPILVGQLNDNMDTIDTVLKDHSDKIDAASLGIKYKGEVNYYADLPNSAEIGDAYTVKYAGSSGTTPDGTEYVWGTVSGTNQWINFSKDSYTKAEVDALLSLKANIADIPTPSTAAPTMDGTAAAGTSTDYARADHVHPSDTSKQDALTAAQLAAVNSGINSTKVAQIETNKNNILSINENIQPSSYNAVEAETGAPITILSGGFVRIGNLVCINLKISITGAISQADTLIKGLPKPILEYNTGYGAVSLNNNIGHVFNVIGVGSIAYGDSTSISSGTVILSGMYIAHS